MNIERLQQKLVKMGQMTFISKLFLLGIILSSLSSFSQTECTTYHRKNCANKEGVAMRYDSQSKSAIMAKGQVSDFHLVAYNGLDYRITLCNEEILGDQIQFRIFEKVKTLIKDESDGGNDSDYNNDSYSNDSYSDSYSNGSEEAKTEPKFRLTKELLYDNASDNYSRTLEFTAEGSKSMIIEITVPGASSGKGKLKIRQMGCVGVLIEHVKSRRSGF